MHTVRNEQYVQLADILVPHQRATVEGRGALGHIVDVVLFVLADLRVRKETHDTYALNKHLVLLSLVVLDRDALEHVNVAHTLLAEEVPDLDALVVARNDHVDGEMRVHGTHLVLEAHRDTLDHVVHTGFGGTQARKVLASAVPDDELEPVALGALDQTEVHRQVAKVLGELAAGALDRHDTRVDLDGHALRDVKVQVLVDGKHHG